ncbi:MAG TPA: type II toxin-antitoxin system RelE/ParE family toxin [Terriglobia bacterium]|nr:type II toxin-antitoxin system RelE/ParE family toxin [Terriglobia bacterium]
MKRQLRWTEEAATDLENIANYLFQHAASRAADLVTEVYKAPQALLTFPYRGRKGKKEGTRELVLPFLPYIVVYQARGELIYIVRILHGAQKWP